MRGGTNIIPWAVVAIAVLALVTFVAGQRFGSSRNGAPEGAGLDDRGGASGGLAGSPGADPAAAMAAGGPTGRAPDISARSPRQRAERLFDRVMRLDAEGKQDSVQMFAPMAMAAYQMIDLLDLDLRYDYGRVARVSGAREVARAQADTILRVNATHLLGLILAGQVARDGGDSVAARAFDRRLVAAEPTEMQRPLDEYKRHQQDILTAAAEARKSRQP